jgi:uncharacterized protein
MDGVQAVNAMFDAIEERDWDKFRSLFTPDAVTWRNFDHIDLPIKETTALVKAVMDVLKTTRYEERRTVPTPDGAVMQFIARSATWEGDTAEVYVIARVYMKDGLVARAEEYADTAQSGAIQAALRKHGAIA